MSQNSSCEIAGFTVGVVQAPPVRLLRTLVHDRVGLLTELDHTAQFPEPWKCSCIDTKWRPVARNGDGSLTSTVVGLSVL